MEASGWKMLNRGAELTAVGAAKANVKADAEIVARDFEGQRSAAHVVLMYRQTVIQVKPAPRMPRPAPGTVFPARFGLSGDTGGLGSYNSRRYGTARAALHLLARVHLPEMQGPGSARGDDRIWRLGGDANLVFDVRLAWPRKFSRRGLFSLGDISGWKVFSAPQRRHRDVMANSGGSVMANKNAPQSKQFPTYQSVTAFQP
jgi:hypothetical protein